MSRTFRKNKYGKKVPDGKTNYKCRCEYCIHLKYNYRKQLTIEEDLKCSDEYL